MKKATIFNRIMSHEITSVEIKSPLGRELYIYSNGTWTDVLDEFGFSYDPKAFCQYVADVWVWSEHNGVYCEILEGKAEHRAAINEAKELLKWFFDNYDYSFFPALYKKLPAKLKEAVTVVLRHAEVYDYDVVSIMFPSTSELSLLWKESAKKQKHKAKLIVRVIGDNYEFTANMFTSEVVDYVDMDIIEGNF